MAKQATRPPRKTKKQPIAKPDPLSSSKATRSAGDAAVPVEKSLAPAIGPRDLFFPALFLVVFLFLWFAPHVTLEDSWNEGVNLVNASRVINDPATKQATLDKAGVVIKDVVRLHPYHARAHFFLAYYYDDAGDYDAAIAEAKEAIRLGSGGTVNQVEHIARDVIVDASIKKAKPLTARKDYAGARRILEDAYAIQPASRSLLTALGNLAALEQSWDSEQKYFGQLLEIDPKDDETWFVMARIALARNRTPEALGYLEKSVALNPNRAAAQDLLSKLKSGRGAGG